MMGKRLKDNIMLIILCIVIICCTVSVNNKIEKEVKENTDYLANRIYTDLPSVDLVYDIYRDLHTLKSKLSWE